ncbi:MAG: cupin domain-containing protein [Candidatus Zhuqueibacterota bacterium]
MGVNIKNMFSDLPRNVAEEIFEELVATESCRIERIISHGQSSPEGFWYDQEQNEWVLVLKGRARLQFEQDDAMIDLNVGDSILIPAHCRHRVEWTDPDQDTIWLAVFYPRDTTKP